MGLTICCRTGGKRDLWGSLSKLPTPTPRRVRLPGLSKNPASLGSSWRNVARIYPDDLHDLKDVIFPDMSETMELD